MILQALFRYYERKCADPDPARRLPRFGFEDKPIPFVLELAADGRLIDITDTRDGPAKKKVAKSFCVPMGVKKTSGVAANLLWDTAEYVLGLDTKDKPERVAQQHAAFVARLHALPAEAQADAGMAAVLAFLAADPLAAVEAHAFAAEIRESNPVVTFRLAGDSDLVCERPAVATAALAGEPDAEAGEAPGICLVTGGTVAPERLHSAIKGVWGAQTSGANIVSFNLDAFRSHGKEQGANAPVSPRAAFAYTTALNHLLARDSRQRMQVGDASTVFWAESAAAAEAEDAFAAVFGEATDDPDARTGRIRAVLGSVQSGGYARDGGGDRFYVLGLAPNAARIAIRFWHVATVDEVGVRIGEWFRDLAIARGPGDAEFPSLFRLLSAVAVLGKADNIPPRLGGDVMRAVLSGGEFPVTWLNAAVQRCRAEQRVTYLRAAAIKACLNRAIRSHSREKEFSPVLDLSITDRAYRLGRLFATLEKIQEEASPGLNATIRERYYGAASSTPATVFTTLLRLKNHHIAKLDSRGRAANFEKLVGEIVGALDPLTGFPAHLALPEQGRFALGYYHQRQAFFTKADKPAESPAAVDDAPADIAAA
ncbi:type I-C CRISPR-associated protein Cas8c/Csd1 [Derxia lacustris]|uniref:type I-C CRISPR-associated protein Cas8c/Csd1 n=1 Tax=Derxia lacustris TaxID=764842 RepID=UPI000A176CD7|nr:type I-C CRISPR-associated protein Cas8c/Csd1 [Derxia lacustris]